MSPNETFFAFGFVSTLTVAILATWFGYVVPLLICQYRILVDHMYHWNLPSPEKSVYNSQQETATEVEIQPLSVV